MKWAECSIRIRDEQLRQMENMARLRPDSEVCGLLYQDAFIALDNVSHTKTSFRADPSELARVLAMRGEPLAVFHTHPSGDPSPSEADQREWFYTRSALIIGTLREKRLKLKSYRIITKN